jgi:hypothetical protein
LGQQTEHTIYRCPCGAGSVRLTSTLFGGGGARRVHTSLVSCAVCKGLYHYTFVVGAEGVSVAQAEHTQSADTFPLSVLTKAHPPES